MLDSYKHIAIEGNIGSGKTTLAKLLAVDLGGKLILEEFEENTFLAKFYTNPERYAFPTELSFLVERFEQLKSERSLDLFGGVTIADYIIEKCKLFAKHNLHEDQLFIFNKVYDLLRPQLLKPDIILYLHSSTDKLLNQIAKRGREMENSIEASYLEGIQEGYFSLFKQMKDIPILLVNADGLDFVTRKEDYQALRELLTKPYEPGTHVIG